MKKYRFMFSGTFKTLVCAWLLFIGLISGINKLSAQNDVMMQAFYWDLPVDKVAKDGNWWDTLSNQSTELKNAGITGIWIPCPAKGNWGIEDMGYGVYDHYDLGNYNQKGSIETRFGSRQELENMISVMHQSPKIDVYADVILNHMYGGTEDIEPNPAVKTYVFGEAHNGLHVAYPTNEIIWTIPDASPGDYYIQIKGYNLDWSASATERGYDVNINWTGASPTENGDWENEPNNGGGQYNTFPGSGYTVRAHADYNGDIDEYKINLSSAHDIVIKLNPKRENFSPWEWVDADATNGFYPVAIWYNSNNLASSSLEAHTYTGINYITHTGAGEPNYSWNYSHFHPVDANDWLGGLGTDEIITNTKIFGNDLNTFDPVVQGRLNDWGYWLADELDFDGFRLDFVRGFQESFVAGWINNLPLIVGNQRFIVGEYWGADYRIKNWVEALSSLGANANGFDFPLKYTLKDMCNGNQSAFNMASLNHAGMVRNNSGNELPGTSVVTFVDNHDTGKEYWNWVEKDYNMAYAYILSHEGRPCIFYPHYYGITQYDHHDPSHSVTAPAGLKEDINKLIFARKTYMGGTLAVLSETGNPYPSGDTWHVYIARRQGNGTKGGVVIVLNNHDSQTKGLWVDVTPSGFENWAGQLLVNAFNPAQTTQVYADGRAWFEAPSRGYSLWVKQSDYVPYALQGAKSFDEEKEFSTITVDIDIQLIPNPATDFTTVTYTLPEESDIKITLYDNTGRLISTIDKGLKNEGINKATINTNSLAPGLYYVNFNTATKTIYKRLLVTD